MYILLWPWAVSLDSSRSLESEAKDLIIFLIFFSYF
jgi:hypothetical protein